MDVGRPAPQVIELVGVALNAACTNLNPDGTRRHIRAALQAGATRDEILFMLKAASLMAIHSCSLGVPVLREEAQAAGVKPASRGSAPTPACDASFTHTFAPGVRRHIKGALRAGATMEETMEVLKLCVVQGVAACNLGGPILAEEMAHHSGRDAQP